MGREEEGLDVVRKKRVYQKKIEGHSIDRDVRKKVG